jgi:hypothetical protein
VNNFTNAIAQTMGNEYISIVQTQQISQIYDYCVAFTVFTSMLKLCRLLRYLELSEGTSLGEISAKISPRKIPMVHEESRKANRIWLGS